MGDGTFEVVGPDMETVTLAAARAWGRPEVLTAEKRKGRWRSPGQVTLTVRPPVDTDEQRPAGTIAEFSQRAAAQIAEKAAARQQARTDEPEGTIAYADVPGVFTSDEPAVPDALAVAPEIPTPLRPDAPSDLVPSRPTGQPITAPTSRATPAARRQAAQMFSTAPDLAPPAAGPESEPAARESESGSFAGALTHALAQVGDPLAGEDDYVLTAPVGEQVPMPEPLAWSERIVSDIPAKGKLLDVSRQVRWSRAALRNLGLPTQVMRRLPVDDPDTPEGWVRVIVRLATVVCQDTVPLPQGPDVLADAPGAVEILRTAAATGALIPKLSVNGVVGPATPERLAMALALGMPSAVEPAFDFELADDGPAILRGQTLEGQDNDQWADHLTEAGLSDLATHFGQQSAAQRVTVHKESVPLDSEDEVRPWNPEVVIPATQVREWKPELVEATSPIPMPDLAALLPENGASSQVTPIVAPAPQARRDETDGSGKPLDWDTVDAPADDRHDIPVLIGDLEKTAGPEGEPTALVISEEQSAPVMELETPAVDRPDSADTVAYDVPSPTEAPDAVPIDAPVPGHLADVADWHPRVQPEPQTGSARAHPGDEIPLTPVARAPRFAAHAPITAAAATASGASPLPVEGEAHTQSAELTHAQGEPGRDISTVDLPAPRTIPRPMSQWSPVRMPDRPTPEPRDMVVRHVDRPTPGYAKHPELVGRYRNAVGPVSVYTKGQAGQQEDVVVPTWLRALAPTSDSTPGPQADPLPRVDVPTTPAVGPLDPAPAAPEPVLSPAATVGDLDPQAGGTVPQEGVHDAVKVEKVDSIRVELEPLRRPAPLEL